MRTSHRVRFWLRLVGVRCHRTPANDRALIRARRRAQGRDDQQQSGEHGD